MDAFDISPSGRRAVISARGQILTIATDRGDITRVAPDKMASRNQSPKWSSDGKYIAFVSDRSGRDEIWISDPEGKSPKKITDLDNEKGALVWTPDSKSLLYTAADKKLYSYTVADGKTAVVASSDLGRIGSVAVSPDSKWVAFSKQDRTLPLARLHRADRRRRRASRLGRQPALLRDQRRLDGRRPLPRVHLGGEHEQRRRVDGRRRRDDAAVGAVAARSGSRSDESRHRQRSAGARGGSGRAADRRRAARRRAAARRRWTCASTGTASRAARIGLTVPGTTIGGLTPTPDGHSVALTVSTAGAGGGRGAAADSAGGMFIINAESGQQTRVPQPAATDAAGRGGGRGGGGGGFGGGGGMVFARDGRTLYFRTGAGLFRGADQSGGGRERGRRRRGGGRRARRSRRARRRRRRRSRRRPTPRRGT